MQHDLRRTTDDRRASRTLRRRFAPSGADSARPALAIVISVAVVTLLPACQPKVVNAPASPPRAIREAQGDPPPLVPLPGETNSGRSDPADATPRVAAPARPITPTLDKERQAQADREAAALGSKVGVRFEPVKSLDKPAWYAIDRAPTGTPSPAGASTPSAETWREFVGMGRAERLRDAYDLAIRTANASAVRQSAGAVRPADAARAAYVRTETGEYVVWVLMRTR